VICHGDLAVADLVLSGRKTRTGRSSRSLHFQPVPGNRRLRQGAGGAFRFFTAHWKDRSGIEPV